jgi:hypothetical protein
MRRFFTLAGLVLFSLCLLATETAQAGRTPSIRTEGLRDPGVRGDAFVAYLTTGYSAFFSGTVGPKVVASPIVDDPKNPGVKPVFNIIFYGGKQSFGDKFNGATPR